MSMPRRHENNYLASYIADGVSVPAGKAICMFCEVEADIQTTECPGSPLSKAQIQQVRSGLLDFVGGKFVSAPASWFQKEPEAYTKGEIKPVTVTKTWWEFNGKRHPSKKQAALAKCDAALHAEFEKYSENGHAKAIVCMLNDPEKFMRILETFIADSADDQP